jgi:hypothetical protein
MVLRRTLIRAALSVLATAVLVALVAPSAASAARVRQASVNATIPGSNGYRIHVNSFRHRVFIDATLDRSGAVYSAKGTVTAKRLGADLGQFGHIDMTFEPRGPARERDLPPRCRGHYEVQRGVYRGTLSFQGEAGFTSAETEQLPGRVVTGNVRCDDRKPPDPDSVETVHGTNATFLDVANTRSSYGTYFSVHRKDGAKRAFFNASVSERLGRIDVSRYAHASAPKAAFSFNLRRFSATVQPPWPFAGQGRLGRGPGGVPSWSGDLSVTLPGAGTVSLTGPAFQAELIRGAIVTIRPPG